MPLLIGTQVPAPLVVQASDWSGMGITWEFGDQVFDLTDLSSGIILSQGVRGFGMPPITPYLSDSPALAGARYLGSQVGPRQAFWPLFIWSDFASTEWVQRDKAFWSTMNPDVPGIWSVTGPLGETRHLECQYTDDGGQSFGLDPMQFGWALYGITLTAYDEPFWQGDPIARTFQAPNPVNFFMSSGGVFFISPSGTTDSAKIPNPGDVEAWPLWALHGPITTASLGVGGGSVDVPFSMSSGESITVDTRPDRMTVIDQSGADRSGDVVWAPQPIPPGAEVDLDITITGSGSATAVSCQITPRFWRPW